MSSASLSTSPWRQIWYHFRQHKVALVSLIILLLLYASAVLADFVAPYSPFEYDPRYVYAPPQSLHISVSSTSGLSLHVYGYQRTRDPATLRWHYSIEPTEMHRVRWFVRGASYRLFGVVKSNLHLFGTEGGTIYLFGTDDLGRDVFSRIVHGGRITLFVGLVGVILSFVIGSLLGGISGYYSGVVDTVVQRAIELISSIPSLPLWMALTAALPQGWSPVQMYFAITVILSLRGWCGLARVVRGQLLGQRTEDYVLAAKLAGQSEWKIITWHLLPSAFSYLVVAATLAVPAMILGETVLSFLGLGLRPPVISWGVLLQQAQNVQTVSLYPWLMIPGAFVVAVVLCFNSVGDGLRDASDPYR